MAATFAVSLLIASSPVQAKHRHHAKNHSYNASHQATFGSPCVFDNNGRIICVGSQETHPMAPMGRKIIAPSNGYDLAENGNDPRPGRWCMWWLRRHLGIAKSAFPKWGWNIARNGKYIGSPASGPAPGVIVVWNHHVGIITGGSPDHWVVLSGNDDHAVRERERSLHGVIAYRWPHGQIAHL